MSAPQVIMGTLSFLVAAAQPVIATTTLTCRTLDPVMSAQGPVSNVCTIRRATHATNAKKDITATQQRRAVGSACVTRWGRRLTSVRRLVTAAVTSAAASVPASPMWSDRTVTSVLPIPGTSPAGQAANAATATLSTPSGLPAMRLRVSVCANQVSVAGRVENAKNSSGETQRSNATPATATSGESPASSATEPRGSVPAWMVSLGLAVTSAPGATRESSPHVNPATNASLSGTLSSAS